MDFGINKVNSSFPFDIKQSDTISANENEDSSVFDSKKEDDEIIEAQDSEYISAKADLYAKLSESTDSNVRAQILAQIQQLDQQNEAEQAENKRAQEDAQYAEDIANASNEFERQEITSNYNYNREREALVDKLSNTSDSAERDMIMAKIQYLDAKHEAEIKQIRRDQREQEYAEAYANATTDAERAEISLNHSYENQRAELTEKLSNASDSSERDAILAQIQQLDKQHEQELDAIRREQSEQQYAEAYANATTDSDRAEISLNHSYENQRAELTEKLSNASSSDERERLIAEIRHLDARHEAELTEIRHAREDQQYAEDLGNAKTNAERQEITENYNYNRQREALMNKLANAANANEREQILAEITALDMEHEAALSNINQE